MDLSTHFHLVHRLRMKGALPPFPHIPWCHAQGQLHKVCCAVKLLSCTNSSLWLEEGPCISKTDRKRHEIIKPWNSVLVVKYNSISFFIILSITHTACGTGSGYSCRGYCRHCPVFFVSTYKWKFLKPRLGKSHVEAVTHAHTHTCTLTHTHTLHNGIS